MGMQLAWKNKCVSFQYAPDYNGLVNEDTYLRKIDENFEHFLSSNTIHKAGRLL